MDIPDQFKEIGLFFTDNGPVTILGKMTMTPGAIVIGDGVSGKKPGMYLDRPNSLLR